MPSAPSARLSVSEVLGLTPLPTALAQAKLALTGDPSVPPSRFDATSLRIFTPRLAVSTWAGRRAAGRTVPVLNLVNRTPTPIAEGWSVRFTRVCDFRGEQLSYDSHNGTDFVVPPGTLTVAAAPGRVVSIRREFNRGGLKVCLDHGGGLMTSHNHLARALVAVGDTVARGQPVALTGYSGLDAVVSFPWVAPHVHWNVFLGGVLVDPFATNGEQSLWRVRNDPKPHSGPTDREVEPSNIDPALVEALLADLQDDERRRVLAQISDPQLRACELVIESTVYPTRFRTPEAGRLLFPEPPPRRPRLDLPFRAEDFDGIAFADELGFR